jgi:hypothetical protein
MPNAFRRSSGAGTSESRTVTGPFSELLLENNIRTKSIFLLRGAGDMHVPHALSSRPVAPVELT